jgi:hypothetical protein
VGKGGPGLAIFARRVIRRAHHGDHGGHGGLSAAIQFSIVAAFAHPTGLAVS